MANRFIQGLLKVSSFQQPWKQRQLSNRIRAIQISGDDNQVTYRSVEPIKEMHKNLIRQNIDTLGKVLTFAANIHRSKKCLGTPEILGEIDEVQPNGEAIKKYDMGEYKWRTFLEVESTATNFGRGLRELGVEPRQNIAIFAETRAEWMTAAHGCFKENIPLVTIYATLGDDGVIHGVSETEASVIITTSDLLLKFKKLLNHLPNVETIVYMEDQLKKTNTDGFKEGVRIVSFSEVVKMGETSTVVASPPLPDDICIIMYTSGSTGNPKGVMISHRNCVATLRGIPDTIEFQAHDVSIGFLPLAHIFELLLENITLLVGIPVGYSNPNTFLINSPKLKRGCKGDANILKPTFMWSVPFILDRISKGITSKVNAGSPLQRAIFNFGLEYKKKWTQKGYGTPLIDKLIFKNIATLLGGRVRLIVSGGASLSPDTHEELQCCLCAKILQGYGLTESTSSATCMDAHDSTFGRVGGPLTVADIRLRSWEEGGYLVTNKPNPQGEIIVGGDFVSPGYYKLPKQTAEVFFDEDGKRWLQTGDIGEFHPDGVLKLIDRKKDLVKLQAGEYVSLGKVESILKTSPLIDNVCVYGKSSENFVVALVVPNQQHLLDFATEEGIAFTKFENLCSSSELNKAVLKKLIAHALERKLQKFEIPAAITIVEEVWTPESGLVTSSFKLKRRDIQNYYQNAINQMYSK